MDYFEARYYNSIIGRWLTPDPLADEYPGSSSYVYTANNPLRYIDPDGRNWEDHRRKREQEEEMEAQREMEERDVRIAEEAAQRQQTVVEEVQSQDVRDHLFSIGVTGVAAFYALGVNFEAGVIMNSSDANANLFIKAGHSMGIAAFGGITGKYQYANYELFRGNSLPGTTLVEIEAGIKYFPSFFAVLSASYGLEEILGGGLNLGFGGGTYVNFTNYTAMSHRFNVIEGFRAVGENPRSKFWRR